MAEAEDTGLVTIRELLVSTLAQSDALAKLLIEKGLIIARSTWRNCPSNVWHIRSFLTPRCNEPRRRSHLGSNEWAVADYHRDRSCDGSALASWAACVY